MTYPNGTLEPSEENPLIIELIKWIKEKNLSWIQAVTLLKRTYNYIKNNYNESKNWFMEKIDLDKYDTIQMEIYCPAKELNIKECMDENIGLLIEPKKCVNCDLKIFKYFDVKR